MEEKFISYRSVKLGMYIMFNTYYNDYSEETEIFGLDKIECLFEVLKTFVEYKYLSEDIKNNVYNFLYQAREIYDDKREERIDLINEIVKLMNQSEIDNSIYFYRNELYKRTYNKKYLKCSDEEILKHVDFINKSISNDFLVFIVSNRYDTTDDEFISERITELIDDDMYYETINCILQEAPYLFKDLTFYNRIVCILDLKQKKQSKLKGLNKKIIKEIKKKNKNT